MAKNITINGQVIPFPQQGDPQPHGEPVTDFAEQVAAILNTLQGPDDIVNTVVSLNNNQTTPANIQQFFLDPASVKGTICRYTIYRTTTTTSVVETGTLIISRKDASPFWLISRDSSGPDAGIEFNPSATTNGQIQYTLSNLTDHVSSTLIFSVKAFSIT